VQIQQYGCHQPGQATLAEAGEQRHREAHGGYCAHERRTVGCARLYDVVLEHGMDTFVVVFSLWARKTPDGTLRYGSIQR
jgi:hypothetical protein